MKEQRKAVYFVIAQLIRRWQMCNANRDTYGVYEMRDLVRDILLAVERNG